MKIKEVSIEFVKGDITEQNTEAVVNAANNRLIMGGGVAGAIRKNGGEEIQKECNKIGPIKVGEAAITIAGKLKARYVIHAATMGMDFETDERKIRDSTRATLELTEQKKIKSISFPALGCGVGGFSLEAAAKIMSEEVLKYIEDNPKTSIKEVRFVLFDNQGYEKFKKVVPEHIGYMQRKKGHYPIPTVDIIIEYQDGIVLIERKNPPFGWAIPGGFVDWGESLEQAAIREAEEETNVEVSSLEQLHTYSEPERDPRFHTISTVFIAKGKGSLKAKSDAVNIKVFKKQDLPKNLAFDHKKILEDYFSSTLSLGR